MLARLPISWKLIFPFIAILVLTTLLLGAVCFWSLDRYLSQSLEEKAKALSRNLAIELSDPLTMGQTDRVQQILDTSRTYDADIVYAVALAADGHVLASTDESLRGQRLKLTDYDRQALKSQKGLRRNLPEGQFEIEMPIVAEFGPTWIVRVAFTSENAAVLIRRAQMLTLVIGGAALLAGICIYVTTISNDILKPIENAVGLATRISTGDLAESVEVTRNDEIGQMLRALNDMVGDLREMAQVAGAIAHGDLNVEIELRSDRDVFGKAFNEMVGSLNEQRRELASREARFRSLCQTCPAGIFETDSGGVTTYVNDRLELISGLSSTDLIGRHWYQIVHQDDRPKVLRDWRVERKDDNFSCEFRMVLPDGQVRWGYCMAAPLLTENKSCIGFVGTIEDVTERKAQEENNQRLALLEQREEFMATLTHDLKNPLIGANRVLELLAGRNIGEVSQRQSELLLQLRDSNKRLLAMIQNLIDAYRYEKDVHALLLEPTDLTKILASCVAEVAPIAKNRDIKVEIQLPEHSLYAIVDSNAIRRVVQNLIDNAIKFTPAGGRVIVGALQTTGELVVHVDDTGLGIAAEEQEHLFKRFSQGKLGRGYTPGSGLGLYLCKQIIDAHGGLIRCRSKQGFGTTFEIVLPCESAIAETLTA